MDVASFRSKAPGKQGSGLLGGEDPLEKGMATHSSILAWRVPWAEKPGRGAPRSPSQPSSQPPAEHSAWLGFVPSSTTSVLSTAFLFLLPLISLLLLGPGSSGDKPGAFLGTAQVSRGGRWRDCTGCRLAACGHVHLSHRWQSLLAPGRNMCVRNACASGGPALFRQGRVWSPAKEISRLLGLRNVHLIRNGFHFQESGVKTPFRSEYLSHSCPVLLV